MVLKRSRHIDAEIGIAPRAVRPPALPLDMSLLTAVFDVLIDSPFFFKDRALRYSAVNRAMADLCGAQQRTDLIGKTAAAFFPPALQRHYEALDRHVLSSGEAVTDRLEISGAIGAQPQWLLFSRFPIIDAKGSVAGVLGVARRLAPPDARHPKYARLATIVRKLRQRFDSALRLPELARSINISSSQLERDFRQVFGLTPQQFQQKLRIEQAIRLLKSRVSIAEIAHACGFADHAAFSRRFKATTGVSPTQYRAMIERRAERQRNGPT
jgi:AraC-like DNA-binding protein